MDVFRAAVKCVGNDFYHLARYGSMVDHGILHLWMSHWLGVAPAVPLELRIRILLTGTLVYRDAAETVKFETRFYFQVSLISAHIGKDDAQMGAIPGGV